MEEKTPPFPSDEELTAHLAALNREKREFVQNGYRSGQAHVRLNNTLRWFKDHGIPIYFNEATNRYRLGTPT